MTDPLYANYWRRKRLLDEECPRFTLLQTSGRELDGGVLEVVAAAVTGKQRVLDVGAGSLTVRDKLVATGFNAQYETLDVGDEYEYTYSSLADVQGVFDAIVLMDVLEHLPLRDGLALLTELIEKLRAGGTLVVQTPNARCIRSPFASDMTHVQGYNLPDLWAYLTCLGCETAGFRVAFRPSRGLVARLSAVASRALITRLLGLDYADNILLVAQKHEHDANAEDAGRATTQ